MKNKEKRLKKYQTVLSSLSYIHTIKIVEEEIESGTENYLKK